MTSLRRLRILAALGLAGLSLAAAPAQRAAASEGTYVVEPNDTLSGIALNFGTTVSALVTANDLASADQISVGQVLVIDGVSGAADTAGTAATPSAGATVYVVQSGDTLSDIALRFGVALDDLATANNIPNWCAIAVGQRLVIPTPGSAAAPALQPQAATTAPADQQGTSATSMDIPTILTDQAQAAGIDPALVKAVAWQESGWQMITAADGGMGVMQLMPDTVDWVSSYLVGYTVNPYDVTDNIHAGVAMLSYYLRLFGDVSLAVAAYHQGLTGVQTQGISAETAHYVANVLALQARFS
jgi:LysM repeat protein